MVEYTKFKKHDGTIVEGVKEIKYRSDEVEFVMFKKKDIGKRFWNIPPKYKVEEVKLIVEEMESIAKDIKMMIKRGEFYDN